MTLASVMSAILILDNTAQVRGCLGLVQQQQTDFNRIAFRFAWTRLIGP